MDVELMLWIGVFIGGYAVALAFLLRLVLTRGRGDAP